MAKRNSLPLQRIYYRKRVYMKKIILFCAACAVVSNSTFAGGLLTNTNQNVAFLRNLARNATFELDGAYSNPAGLAWLGNGFHLSLNIQSAYQNRFINTTYAPLAYNLKTPADAQFHREYKGEAAAPVIPSVQAAYQKGDWTASMNFAITGGGGKATFNEGLPMFESLVAYANAATGTAAAGVNQLAGMLSPMGVSVATADATQGYSIDTWMRGRQYVYGLQLGVTYRIMNGKGNARQGLSVHAGGRMNYVSNRYEGYLCNMKVALPDGGSMQLGDYMNDVAGKAQAAGQTATALAASPQLPEEVKAQLGAAGQQLTGASAQLRQNASRLDHDLELDCSQKGWGITPILGVDYRVGNLNLGARYEFQTNLNIENDTKVNTTGVVEYDNGVNTPNDLPAILSVGAQYEILPKWRAMAGMTYYFDKNAGMKDNKQKHLTHNTREFLAGMEYDVLDRLTVSAGYQNTNYGLSDKFQSDLAFSCDSYSLGLGVKVKVTEKCELNAAYFWTTYSDYTSATDNYKGTGIAGTDVYSRTNKVFGVGVNYHF